MLVTQALQFPCLGIFLYHHPRFLCLQPLGSCGLLMDTKLQCGRQQAELPAPFTLYGATGVGRKESEKELAQFPEMSGSLGREGTLPPGWLPHCSWSHRWIIIQPALVCSYQLLSGLQWNWATRIRPSKNRSVKFSEWRKDPYPSQVRGCPRL